MSSPADRIDQAIRTAERYLRQAYLDNNGVDDWDTVRRSLNEARIEIERIVDLHDRGPGPDLDPEDL